MNATDSSITFLDMQAVFKVPFFQRAYVWDEENWKGLWETLSSPSKNNFLGSIILKYLGVNNDNKIEYLIIDGQQRITTLSILAQSLIDGLNLKQNYSDYYDHLHGYLFNRQSIFSKGDKVENEKIKLISSRNDKKDYQDVISGAYLNNYRNIVSKSKIVNCYRYFRTRIDDAVETDEINNLVANVTEDSRKTLVKIILEGEDNEQSIFDTINRAGVRLTASDIVKNNLFDKLSELLDRNIDEVEDFFDKTWGKTFEETQETIDIWLAKKSVGKIERTNLELFLQSFAFMKPDLFDPTQKGAKIDQIAEAYKNYCINFNLNELKDFIKNLCSYADTYRSYFIEMKADIMDHGVAFKEKNLTDDENEIKHILQILSFIDTTTFDAYVLKTIFENSDVSNKLKSLENYIVRDYIYKQGADKNFNNEGAQLIKDPIKYTPAYFFESKNIDDRSLENSLHNMRSNDVAKLLLYWVELKRSYENDSDQQIILVTRKTHQLEHIMPQSPEKYWPIDYPTKDSDGNDLSEELFKENKQKIDEERAKYIYYLGNMTLLNGKKNNELSNASFENKKNGFRSKSNKFISGYNDSSKFLITSSVINSDSWGEEQIIKRTEELFHEIVSLWPVETNSENI